MNFFEQTKAQIKATKNMLAHKSVAVAIIGITASGSMVGCCESKNVNLQNQTVSTMADFERQQLYRANAVQNSRYTQSRMTITSTQRTANGTVRIKEEIKSRDALEWFADKMESVEKITDSASDITNDANKTKNNINKLVNGWSR